MRAPLFLSVLGESVHGGENEQKSNEREREQEQDAPSASQLRFIRLSFSLSLSSPSYLCLEPLQLPEDARRGASRGRRAVLILRLGSLGRRGGGRGRHRRRRFSSCLDECSQVECFLACPASSLGSEEAASSSSLLWARSSSLSLTEGRAKERRRRVVSRETRIEKESLRRNDEVNLVFFFEKMKSLEIEEKNSTSLLFSFSSLLFLFTPLLRVSSFIYIHTALSPGRTRERQGSGLLSPSSFSSFFLPPPPFLLLLFCLSAYAL